MLLIYHIDFWFMCVSEVLTNITRIYEDIELYVHEV